MMILLQVAPDIENQYQHGFSKDRSKGAPVKYYQLLQVLRKPDSPRDVRPSVRPSAPRPPVRLVGRPSDRFFGRAGARFQLMDASSREDSIHEEDKK